MTSPTAAIVIPGCEELDCSDAVTRGGATIRGGGAVAQAETNNAARYNGSIAGFTWRLIFSIDANSSRPLPYRLAYVSQIYGTIWTRSQFAALGPGKLEAGLQMVNSVSQRNFVRLTINAPQTLTGIRSTFLATP